LPLQLGVCLRTLILDEQIGKFLSENPEAVVVNLGSGLDTVFRESITAASGGLIWICLKAWRYGNVFSKRRIDTGLLRNPLWTPHGTDEIPKGSKTLIVAEGLCMYFTESEMKNLIRIIKDSFPGSQFLLEAFSHRAMKSNKNRAKSELDRNAADLLKWGDLKAGKGNRKTGFEGIRFVNEWFVT